MSYSDHDYVLMINLMRRKELVTLYKLNKRMSRQIASRRRSYFEDQVIGFLINKPQWLNYQKFLSDIVKLTGSLPNTEPQLPGFEQNCEPHQYPQQSTSTSQVALNQGMNAIVNHENSSTSSAQSPVDIEFQQSPFFKVHTEIIKPATLTGNDKIQVQSEDVMVAKCNFFLPQKVRNIISRDKNKNEYLLQIRIGNFETESVKITDCFPSEIVILINDKHYCHLPQMDFNKPINLCLQFLNLKEPVLNNITIKWATDEKTYVMGMHFLKKLTSNTLIQKILKGEQTSYEDTKYSIMKQFTEYNTNLAAASYHISLVCPLGRTKMIHPAKPITCQHLQCFDLNNFILMNEKKSTWKCPICNQPCLYKDIKIDSYFSKVVRSPNLPEDCTKIELFADGSWKVSEDIVALIEETDSDDSDE